jgi:uncharacterized protein
MFIEFDQQSSEKINFAHVYQPHEVDLNEETAQVAGELEIAGTASRNSEVAKVEGRLIGKLEVDCSRCLKPVDIALDLAFDEDYVTLETYERASAEHELKSSDLSLSIYDGERVDLDEIVREQILLNIPTRHICSENCKGFCEKCGTNQNENSCSCGTEEIDPRWSALKQLKIKTD